MSKDETTPSVSPEKECGVRRSLLSPGAAGADAAATVRDITIPLAAAAASGAEPASQRTPSGGSGDGSRTSSSSGGSVPSLVYGSEGADAATQAQAAETKRDLHRQNSLKSVTAVDVPVDHAPREMSQAEPGAALPFTDMTTREVAEGTTAAAVAARSRLKELAKLEALRRAAGRDAVREPTTPTEMRRIPLSRKSSNRSASSGSGSTTPRFGDADGQQPRPR
mmetsp:Transcript_8071/g.20685  ORF Transcript_8071/g.20685 Transcript_8071/m.20685 type:complete len:223 (-) Transcript_8071:164-832(-)|eukprot:CAMPEP_0206323128 /NCGR_PEP_ID=MMETSP0106_2-20121207/19800_1 /ASSEMBLY_ACC=CAM_ASM_000206 /TAXON_ID=81532 /ORGANISM="Acanthoeca-like sp., Strain 10tr" /LENGTH=222 /DNA_ID=CAMNT_0053755359 /DNA_START=36 /DNA_END=704 /DNA_ORIENTATION=+